MKILFKNTTKYTREKYNDFIEFHKNKYGTKMLIQLAIVCLCILYITIVNILNKNWIFILAVIGIAIIVCIAKNLNFTKKTNVKALKRQRTFNFIFYEKYIKIKCGRKIDKLYYFQVHKIFETKEYFFLYTDEKHSLILSKDGFEVGTPRTFAEFIRKKCPLKYKKEK